MVSRLFPTVICFDPLQCVAAAVVEWFDRSSPIMTPSEQSAKEIAELLPPLGKAVFEENYVVRLEGHVET